MKDGAGTTTHRGGGVHRWLVVGEIALSLIVLLGAGLLIRATGAIQRFDFGYDANHVLQVWLPRTIRSVGTRETRSQDAADATMVYRRVADGVGSLPGIRSTALVATGIPDKSHVTSLASDGAPRELGLRSYLVVSPGFLSLLGVPVVDGRSFEAGDTDSIGVAIVDDSAAARLWPHDSPVGRMLKLGGSESKADWVRVVGVARTVRIRFETDPDLPPEPQIYVARSDVRHHVYPQLIVRTGSDEAAARVTLARYLSSAIRGGSSAAVVSWSLSFDDEVRMRRFLSLVFALIAAFALALSTVGLYSVLAYSGARRMREYAMRIALGARTPDMLRLVFNEAGVLILGGTAVGALVAMWSAEILRAWLYSIDPMDAPSLVAAEAVLILVSLAASLAPAVRATRANPVDILRST